MTLKKKVSNKLVVLLLLYFLLCFNSYSQNKSYEVMSLEIAEHNEIVEDYWKPGHIVKYSQESGTIVIHYVETDKYKVYLPDVKESKTWKDGTKNITEYYSGKDLTGDEYSARVILDDVNDVYLFSFFSETGDKKAWHYWCRRKE